MAVMVWPKFMLKPGKTPNCEGESLSLSNCGEPRTTLVTSDSEPNSKKLK